MAGYSGKPLAEKLGLRPGHHYAVLHAPSEVLAAMEPLPAGVVAKGAEARELDLVLLCSRERAALVAEFPRAAARLRPAGMLWVAWPKKASKQPTDLTEDVVRAVGLAAGLVDVKVCAVDETWSGLKFVRRKTDR